MKTLVTADLHLSANVRDRYRHDTVRALTRIAKAKRVERTLILGDLTEEKDRHSDWLVNAIVEHVKAFARLGEVIIMQGNHDSYTDPDCPFFHFLRHVPQVRWIGKPTTISADGLGRVLFLPHTRNWQKAWSGLSFKNYEWIFAHGMFVGTVLGNGRQSAEGIPIKTFPRSARIIAGDVHIPQRVGPVEYVGAPYTIDFGDAYNARALIIEDDRTRNIRLDHLPQKRLLEFDAQPNEADQLEGVRVGDILKIKITMPRKHAAKWPEARDEIRAHFEKYGCVVHTIVPVLTERPGPRVENVQRDAKSDEQVMKEFARHRGIDRSTLRIGERLL